MISILSEDPEIEKIKAKKLEAKELKILIARLKKSKDPELLQVLKELDMPIPGKYIITKSGLKYKVLKKGPDGAQKATVNSSVRVHYIGKLVTGQEFDSSYKRGAPATFKVNQVIKGWTEGLQLMTPGSKYEFYIPASLAYGTRGAGDMIPPNSDLIFTIELFAIQ